MTQSQTIIGRNPEPSATLHVRPPQHLKPTPLVYVEGTDPGGPGYLAATLFGAERISQMYWLDLDGDAEVYTSGTGIQVIEPGLQWPDLIGQLRALVDVAALSVADTGQWPVLVLNSITTTWRQCQRWAHHRAYTSLESQRIIKGDKRNNIPPNPNAVIETAHNHWEDAHARHRHLVKTLRQLPMIVIALGRSTVHTSDSTGRALPHGQDYRLNAHADWPHCSQIWVRTCAQSGPRVMSVMDREWHAEYGGGLTQPVPDPGLSLESLIFDTYRLRMPEAPPDLPTALDEASQEAPVVDTDTSAADDLAEVG